MAQVASEPGELLASCSCSPSREGRLSVGGAQAVKRESQLKKLFRLCNVEHFNNNWGAIAFREIEGKFPG
ncbi:rCG61315 [Rattus norvegicus]|uniref:RCG61315 n=1 Tax=Rattus norvegicus TaxID=10116 RepID=A6HA22_RAT|nr:rCG61315 [Rattus norvegicus]